MIQKAMRSDILKEHGTHDAKYHSRYSQVSPARNIDIAQCAVPAGAARP